jgi:hypothetical protein
MMQYPHYFPKTEEEWNEPYPHCPSMTKGQAAEMRARFEDFAMLVQNIATKNWPPIEKLNEFEPEDAARFRRILEHYLPGAIECLSTWKQAQKSWPEAEDPEVPQRQRAGGASAWERARRKGPRSMK